MGKDTPVKISKHFKTLTDPRVVGRTNHKLIDIVTIALCAIICGADNWPEIESYGKAKYDWFKEFLQLPPRRQLQITTDDNYKCTFYIANPPYRATSRGRE